MSNPISLDNLSPERIRAMEEMIDTNQEELSKYSLLHDMSDMNLLRFFSRIQNEDERLRLNTIEMAIDLMKKRFNIDEDNIMIKMLKNHITTHLLNGVSMKGLREKAYVDALKSEHWSVSTAQTNELKKWTTSK